MNSADVIKMLNAGFTREEILNMDTAPAADPQPAPAAAPQPAPATDPQPAPAATPQPAPAADPQPAQAPAADPQPAAAPSWDRLMQEFADLKRAVQAGNRNAAQQPAPVTMDGETVLANIIAPTKTKNK